MWFLKRMLLIAGTDKKSNETVLQHDIIGLELKKKKHDRLFRPHEEKREIGISYTTGKMDEELRRGRPREKKTSRNGFLGT